MQLTLTGATGFIGSRLVALLGEQGHTVRLLSRKSGGPSGAIAWNPTSEPPSETALAGSQAVIHLAGEPVAQRWNPDVKKRIRDSRVLGTQNLIQALSGLSHRPEVLVAASAVGYYGSRGDEVLTESSRAGTGFLADTCQEWEEASKPAERLGIRVVRVRIGVVLGSGGGALKQMLPPFRAGLGGPLAGGRMWMPWIHIEDLCRLVVHAIEHQEMRGAVNAVSPCPVRNSEFTAALGVALNRPAFLPVPEFALRLLYGEMAEVVLGSQRVVPTAAETGSFRFSFSSIDAALQSLVG